MTSIASCGAAVMGRRAPEGVARVAAIVKIRRCRGVLRDWHRGVPRSDPIYDNVEWHWPRNVVVLRRRRSILFQELQVFRSLYTFSNEMHCHLAPQQHARLDAGIGVTAGESVQDEGFVDLELGKREIPQYRQIRMTGAEFIIGKLELCEPKAARELYQGCCSVESLARQLASAKSLVLSDTAPSTALPL